MTVRISGLMGFEHPHIVNAGIAVPENVEEFCPGDFQEFEAVQYRKVLAGCLAAV